MELESLDNLEGVEVPDDDIGLDKDLAYDVSNSKKLRRKTYLEAHVSLLATCHVLSSVGDGDHRDVVVVSLQWRSGWLREAGTTYSEELLCSGNDVSDHDGGSQGIDKVFVIRVEDKSADDLAYMVG